MSQIKAGKTESCLFLCLYDMELGKLANRLLWALLGRYIGSSAFVLHEDSSTSVEVLEYCKGRIVVLQRKYWSPCGVPCISLLYGDGDLLLLVVKEDERCPVVGCVESSVAHMLLRHVERFALVVPFEQVLVEGGHHQLGGSVIDTP